MPSIFLATYTLSVMYPHTRAVVPRKDPTLWPSKSILSQMFKWMNVVTADTARVRRCRIIKVISAALRYEMIDIVPVIQFNPYNSREWPFSMQSIQSLPYQPLHVSSQWQEDARIHCRSHVHNRLDDFSHSVCRYE